MQTVRAGQSRKFSNRIYYWRSIAGDRLPRHQTGQCNCDADVENGADDQRRNDSDGKIALWIFGFLRCGRNGVESNVGEENYRSAGEYA